MKKLFLLTISLSFFFLFSACNKENLTNTNAPNWIKIVVPDASSIYSFARNIKEALLVGTLGEIQKTTDQGATWMVTKDSVTAYELQEKGDTILAFSLHNASYLDYYTLNKGATWLEYPNKLLNTQRDLSLTVKTSTGILFKIIQDETYPKRPDTLVKSIDNGQTWVNILPFKHYLYSIYIDKFDRIYVGAIGWTWDETKEQFLDNGENNGIIYYLEK